MRKSPAARAEPLVCWPSTNICCAMIWLALFSGAGAAQDFIETEGLLSDDDFYRLVSCRAAPSQPCAHRPLFWQTDRPLRVRIAQIDPAFLGGRQKRAKAALARAIQYINRAEAGISLVETSADQNTDISVYFLNANDETPVRGVGLPDVDGETVRGARVWVWANSDAVIQRSVIVFSTALPMRQYESAMIEEVTQSLGLMTDIRNPLYNGVSVFAEDSNAAKDLGKQDVMALRRHYPPKE